MLLASYLSETCTLCLCKKTVSNNSLRSVIEGQRPPPLHVIAQPTSVLLGL